MNLKWKGSLFVVFTCIILAFEIVLRAVTVTPFFGIGLLTMSAGAVIAGAILYAVSCVFKERMKVIFGAGVIIIEAFLYGAQLVYNEIFHTYYTVYSMTHGIQAAQFWRDIMIGMGKQAVALIAVVTVAGVGITICIKYIEKNNKNSDIKVAARAAAFSAAVFVIAVTAGGRGVNTPYGALFKINSIDASIRQLGYATAAVLDVQRLVFGFEPVQAANNELDEELVLTPEYGFNEMDIDFAALADGETDAMLKQMNLYFDSVMPSKKNEKTGVFKGKNLVMVVAESFSSYAISEKYTPTLYKMQNDGYTFTNFYNPIWGVSTSDGEYVATTGLLPKAGVWSMRESSQNSLPFTMGNQFRKLGVETRAYHNHYAEYYGRTESHPNLGYIYKGLGTGLNVKEQWPESDLEMLELTTPEYLTLTETVITNDDGESETIMAVKPFHTYYMTVSGHLNYNFQGQAMCARHKNDVADLEMSEACCAYIASQIELDLAMEHLLNELEEVGELENTVIVISGDHYPYGLTGEQISEFVGHPVEEKFELYKSSLIIYNSGSEPETIEKYCSSLDIIPTVSNLFGLEYDSRLLMGRDIFSDSDPLVIFKDMSWITDKGAYNAQTGEFTAFEAEASDADNIGSSADKNQEKEAGVSDEYISGINNRVENKFNYSRLILEKDYYRYLGL